MDPDELTQRARREAPDAHGATLETQSLGLTGQSSSLSSSPLDSSAVREEEGRSLERVRAVIQEWRLAVLRRFVWAMAAVCALGIPAIFVLPEFAVANGRAAGGSHTREMQLLALLSLGMLLFVYVYSMRQVERRVAVGVTSALSLPMGALAIASAVALNVALGIFAPLPFAAMVALSIIYLGVASTVRDANILYFLSAVGFPIPMLLVFAGVIEDHGLLQLQTVDRQGMLVAFASTEMAFAVAYMLGRTTARYGAHMIERLDSAVREATRREALLSEVRADLERAAGIGVRGLFSDLELGGFVLGNVIGRGGMGEVYDAQQRSTGAHVAVKILRREDMASAEAVDRFAQEARIAAELTSDHVVRVLEVGGRDATLPFIAMELLHGVDLAGLLRARSRLPVEEVVTLVREVCAGLEAAHARGIVHRDLKPQNLFRADCDDGERRWKILDFGVSKLLGSGDAGLGGERLVGTPNYMAPEQAEGSGDIDTRADLYSLTVVAYRALTGAQAFGGGSAAGTLEAVCERMPADPRSLTTMPDDLRRVLRIGLAKSPSDRFATAAELAECMRMGAASGLPPGLRARADELERKQAWGAGVSPPEEAESTRGRGAPRRPFPAPESP